MMLKRIRVFMLLFFLTTLISSGSLALEAFDGRLTLRGVEAGGLEQAVNALLTGTGHNLKAVSELYVSSAINQQDINFILTMPNIKALELQDAQYTDKVLDGEFCRLAQLTSVYMPGGRGEGYVIGQGVFMESMLLRQLAIPDGVTGIGDFAFAVCPELPSVELPSSLREIGEGAFMLCESLEWVKLPASLETIGAGAFSECTGLKTVYFPSSIRQLIEEGEGIFEGVDNIEFIELLPKNDAGNENNSGSENNAGSENNTGDIVYSPLSAWMSAAPPSGVPQAVETPQPAAEDEKTQPAAKANKRKRVSTAAATQDNDTTQDDSLIQDDAQTQAKPLDMDMQNANEVPYGALEIAAQGETSEDKTALVGTQTPAKGAKPTRIPAYAWAGGALALAGMGAGGMLLWRKRTGVKRRKLLRKAAIFLSGYSSK